MKKPLIKFCDPDFLWEDKPHILEANTYFWGGFYGNGEQRERQSQKYRDEVESWFNKVASCLGNKAGKINIYQEDDCVYMGIDGKVVAEFCITSSRRNVYKHQNIRKLKTIMKKYMKKPKVKTYELGTISDEQYEYMSNIHEIPYVVIPKNIINAKNGDIKEVKINTRKYIGFFHDCTKERCLANLVPEDEDSLENYFGTDMCNKEFLEALEKSKIDMSHISQFCVAEKMKKL